MKLKIKITTKNKNLTESDILKFEQRIGLRLPIEYREFILLHNGGEPSPEVFPLIGHPTSKRDILNRFLCIEDGNLYDISYMISILGDQLPNDLLPIAIDPGGNLICIGIKGERHSKIYFCALHEGLSGEINIYPLADSFIRFLESLEYFSN